MVRVIYKAIFAMLGAIACSSTQADMSVAYSAWQPGKEVTRALLVKELTIVALNFSVIRTFHAVMNNISIIEVAAEVGLRIDVGIHMTDEATIASEIEAVCVAYTQYGEIIRTVYVGNENLKNDKFGTFEYQEIIKYIKQVKACVGTKVRVGTVQRVTEWLKAPGAKELAAECSACGANIHPYFADASTLSPIEMLKAQWGQIETKYGNIKNFTVAETGWPTGGGSYNNANEASVEIAQQYLIDVTLWSKTHTVTWFMFSDSLEPHNGLEVEKHFGLYDAACTKAKLILPAKTDSGNTTSAYGPSPVPSPSNPVTPVTPPSTSNPVTLSPTQITVTPGPQLDGQMEMDPPTPMPMNPETRATLVGGDKGQVEDKGQTPTPGKPVEVHDDVLHKGNKPVTPSGKDCTIEAP